MIAVFDAPLEAAIRRDRLVVLIGLLTVMVLSWAYLVAGAGMGMSGLEMTRMSQLELTRGMSGAGMAHHAMLSPAVWTPSYAALMFFMWWVMQVAMMLPSAAPMILVFATVNRGQRDGGRPYVATSVFAFAYLIAWAGFSLVAVILQWGLEHIGALSPMLVATNALLGGGLLLAAGIYQLTPIKQACLRHCRSPMAFINAQWRPGVRGALRMGLVHGAFCVACCWFLMGLMFLGGLMNLYWIAGLALFVLLEKTIPAGRWFSRGTGVLLLVWGAATVIAAV